MKWFKVFGQDVLNDDALMSLSHSDLGLWFKLISIASVQKSAGVIHVRTLKKVYRFHGKTIKQCVELAVKCGQGLSFCRANGQPFDQPLTTNDFKLLPTCEQLELNIVFTNWYKHQSDYALRRSKENEKSNPDDDNSCLEGEGEGEEEIKQEGEEDSIFLSADFSFKKALQQRETLEDAEVLAMDYALKVNKSMKAPKTLEKARSYFEGKMADGLTFEGIYKHLTRGKHDSDAGWWEILPKKKKQAKAKPKDPFRRIEE